MGWWVMHTQARLLQGDLISLHYIVKVMKVGQKLNVNIVL
jgi:hypothetical protein